MNKFIEIKLIEKKRKTCIYSIRNRKGDYILGHIKWYGSWRQYCFFPEPNTTWNRDCMDYVIAFIKELMEERVRDATRMEGDADD